MVRFLTSCALLLLLMHTFISAAEQRVEASSLHLPKEKILEIPEGIADAYRVPAGRSLMVWEDKTTIAGLDEALVMFRHGQFKAVDSDAPNYGFSQSAFWLAGEFRPSPTDEAYLSFEWPNLDWIDAYIFQDGSLVSHLKSGDRLSFQSRSLKNRFFHFKLPSTAPSFLLVRIRTTGATATEVFFQNLRSIASRDHETQMFLGLFLGAVLIMTSYFLLAALAGRNKEYLYLALFFFNVAVYRATFHGLTFEYILPETPWLANAISPMTMIGIGLFLSVYSYHFLEIAQYPRLKFVGQMTIRINCVLMMLATAFEYRVITLCIYFTGFTGVFWWISSAICWHRGLAAARFYVLAIVLPVTSILSGAFISMGLVPAGLLNYLVEINIGIFMCALAYSAGEKIKMMNTRSKLDQEARVKAQKEASEAIDALNQNLARKVEEKTKEISSIMNSVKLGIVSLLPKGFRIGPEYTRHTEQILNASPLAGESIFHVLFNRSTLSSDTVATLHSVLDFSMGGDPVNFEINSGNLVREVSFDTDHGQKTLQLGWSPVEDRQGLVEKIVLTIEDVSDLYELKKINAVQQKKLRIMESVLIRGYSSCHHTINRIKTALLSSRKLLDPPVVSRDDSRLSEIFHLLHTAKGNARTMTWNSLSSAIHDCESILASAQAGHPWDRHHFEICLSEIELETKIHEEAMVPFAGKERNVREEMTLSGIMHSLRPAIKTTAMELAKPEPTVTLTDDGTTLGPCLELISDALMHLINNALDHGIEAPDVRRDKGKPERGNLEISVHHQADNVCIHVNDDGAGISIETIKARAAKRGLRRAEAPLSDEEWVQTILMSGFTTRDEVTAISGRGIGLDAVATALSKADSRFDILLGPTFPDGNRCLIFRILLPLASFELSRSEGFPASAS